MENKIEVGFKPRTWLLVILIIIGLAITVVLADKYIAYRKVQKSKRESIFEKLQKKAEEQEEKFNKEYEETQKEIEEEEKASKVESFNSWYEFYAGSQYSTPTTWVLEKVITHNKTSKDHILTVKRGDTETTDEETIRNIKNSLSTSKQYEIIYDYDADGYIYRINIR